MTPRRPLLAIPFLAGAAQAQPVPGRPIRLVVPFAAGGVTDVIARVLGERLGQKLGVPVIVENRAGANGNIGAETVVRAEPDGHTLLMATAGVFAVNPGLYRNLAFSTLRDLAPVSKIYDTGNILIVHPRVPARSVAELVALTRAEPNRLSLATGGSGSSSHMFAALFQQAAGITWQEVPYRSNGPALTDLLAGTVDMLFDQIPSGAAHAAAGRLRALAVTTARVPSIPDVPSFAEAGFPQVMGTFWVALAAPARTPPAMIAALNRAVVEVLEEPAIRARLSGMGADPAPSTPEALGALIAADSEKWGAVVRAANLRPE